MQTTQHKKIGMICRMDNSGVGTLSWEFARHLKPHKILLVENNVHQTFPERYANFNTKKVSGNITPELKQWFLDDIDVFFTIETPYDWSLIKDCRKKAIKTVLYTMYEMTPDPVPIHFDWYLCPSKLDYDVMPSPKKFIPVPVATDKLLWKKREYANTFIHSASHGGLNGRKGTQLLLDAIPLVQSNVKFKIFSWKQVYNLPNDSRLEFKVVNFKNYWQLWREGDVLIYPQDYNGICLPIIEAMSCGLGVITTNIYPFNEYMPKNLLFNGYEKYKTRAGHNLMQTEAVKIDPQDIANKIDWVANKYIGHYSEYGKQWSKDNSWETLTPKYVEFFNNL